VTVDYLRREPPATPVLIQRLAARIGRPLPACTETTLLDQDGWPPTPKPSRHPLHMDAPAPLTPRRVWATPSRASARWRGYINLPPVQQLHATSSVGRGVDANGALANMEGCPWHHGCASRSTGPAMTLARTKSQSAGGQHEVNLQAASRPCAHAHLEAIE
jgi:hypothetical protein